MIFNYSPERTFAKAINVDDMGNMNLRISTEDITDYYLATQTIMGKTYILFFGPLVPDIEYTLESQANFSLSTSTMNYDEKKLSLAINKIIQNPRLKVETIEEVGSLNEVLSYLPAPQAFVVTR